MSWNKPSPLNNTTVINSGTDAKLQFNFTNVRLYVSQLLSIYAMFTRSTRGRNRPHAWEDLQSLFYARE